MGAGSHAHTYRHMQNTQINIYIYMHICICARIDVRAQVVWAYVCAAVDLCMRAGLRAHAHVLL